MFKTPYENWMNEIIKNSTNMDLSKESLKIYHLKKLREAVMQAKKSKFYYEKLKYVNVENIKSLEDFSLLPFTVSEDIRKNPYDFLAVPPSKIERIVTLNTSGTTKNPKRIFFTLGDIEKTIEFFTYGMQNLVSAGDKVLILMSGENSYSIGKLLIEGLLRANIKGIIYGAVKEPYDALKKIKEEKIDSIVGLPIQVYYMAKLKENYKEFKDIKLKSILLSADYISRSLQEIIRKSFNCPVFIHYGMTEMGYGGGVSCKNCNCYHMREVDLFTEIIDTKTGKGVKEGQFGEVVFTTLHREGMPLIRYRTGDISRFTPKNCSCAEAFKSLDYIKERIENRIYIDKDKYFSIGMLDEVIFSMENVMDYKGEFIKQGSILKLWIKPINSHKKISNAHILDALKRDVYFNKLLDSNLLHIEFMGLIEALEVSSGMIKRKILLID